MDQSHPTPSHTACPQCKKGYLCPSTKKYSLTKANGQLFPQKDHHLPQSNPCSPYWRNPLQIPETQEGVQRRGIAKTTPAYHLGPCYRTTSGSPRIATRMTPPPYSKQNC